MLCRNEIGFSVSRTGKSSLRSEPRKQLRARSPAPIAASPTEIISVIVSRMVVSSAEFILSAGTKSSR